MGNSKLPYKSQIKWNNSTMVFGFSRIILLQWPLWFLFFTWDWCVPWEKRTVLFWANTVPSSGVWPLQMGPTGCYETSVRNYHNSLCNCPEEHSSHLLHGGSVKLCTLFLPYQTKSQLLHTEHCTKPTMVDINHIFKNTHCKKNVPYHIIHTWL